MPGVGSLWSEALAEANTLVVSSDVILHTLELRIPQEGGGFSAVRCVLDHGDLLVAGDPPIYGHILRLEGDAPLNAGQDVMFVACMFDMSLPSQQEQPPAIEITIDNVAQIISPLLDAATGLNRPIEVTYREYLASDLTQPQYKLPNGVLQRVISTVTRIRATVVFTDLVNRNFPSLVYRPTEFPGLSR